MFGENDVKYLFIYSIDDFFRVIPLSKLRKLKDGTVLYALLGIILFLLKGDELLK